jgi:hypothetical protein
VVTLNDPMFYLELAGHCLNEAYRCGSVTAAKGLRKLAQGYLDMAEAVQAEKRQASAPAEPVRKAA